MNYRHAYHAGNFADIFKHLVLARIVDYLKRKDKPFRVIDTHAGVGLYDLTGEEAQRTGEWRDGIGRLRRSKADPKITSLVNSLLAIVDELNPDGAVTRYPGSPLIARKLLRKQDRLTAIEMHPRDAASLKALFDGDFQCRVIELDGWLALGAHLPPKEKRGLVLVDPPFENADEFERLTDGLAKAYRRWPTGVYALWYPIKDRAAVNRFRIALAETGIPRIIDVRFSVRGPSSEPRLDGCGMAIVNPPYTLAGELKIMLPWLARLLADGPGGGFTITTLAGEEVST